MFIIFTVSEVRYELKFSRDVLFIAAEEEEKE
jgi:hypothetical protein